MELPCLPHAFFDLADFFLVYVKEAGRLTVTCDLGDEREIVDMVQRIVEPGSLISAILEVPKVIVCVPWSFLLTVVRDRVQRSSVLTVVSRYNANYMGIWTHNNSCVMCWNTPSLVVGDDTGDKVDPSIEVEP